MPKKCKRKHTTYQGVRVVLPCRARSLTATHRAAIADEFTKQQLTNAARDSKRGGKSRCSIIFWNKVPHMRCETRRLKPPPKMTKQKFRAWKGKKICRYKAGPKKGQFRKCGGRAAA